MKKTITVKYTSLLYRVWLRFARMFVIGGIGFLMQQLVVVPKLSTLEELQTWFLTLFAAFIIGGVAAIDKYFRG